MTLPLPSMNQKDPTPLPASKKILKLGLLMLALGAVLCVQGCSDEEENPLFPAPWLPVGVMF
jgi:hypothetical protein